MTEPVKKPVIKKPAVKRRKKKPNTVEENLMTLQAVAGALLTAYNIAAPLIRKIRNKRAAKRRSNPSTDSK